MDFRKLGERVRRQRELNDFTQSDLARKIGVSNSFIGQIERGEKKTSVDTLVALCNALEISPSVLLQDSLSEAVLQSQLEVDAENQLFMRNIMHVLREHTTRQEYR